jgi:hypothetical protein
MQVGAAVDLIGLYILALVNVRLHGSPGHRHAPAHDSGRP